MITGQFVRGFRRTAFLKDGSSGSENNRQAASDLAKKALEDAKQPITGSKKESFDDFYESLMKGKGQSARAPSSAGPAGVVNLDGILSSLNKSPSEFKKEEADSRFAQIFQRKAVEEEEDEDENEFFEEDEEDDEENVFELEESADTLAGELAEDDQEFLEFMKALRVDYEHKKANGILPKSAATPFRFPKATPGLSAKIPSKMSDLSKLNAEQAKKDFSDALHKINPELAASAARGDLHRVSRSQAELLMAKKDAREQVHLDEALHEIDRTGVFPDYVVGARIPNLSTGESKYVDLLDAYSDPALGDVAELAAEEAEAKNSVLGEDQDDDDGEYDLSATDEAFLNSPMTANLFEALQDESKSIDEMQYWSLFPKAVKRWLVYTRAPKGFYNDFGEWVIAPPRDPQELLADEVEHLNDQIVDEYGEPSLAQADEDGELALGETDEFGEEFADEFAREFAEADELGELAEANELPESTENMTFEESDEANSRLLAEFSKELGTEENFEQLSNKELEKLAQAELAQFEGMDESAIAEHMRQRGLDPEAISAEDEELLGEDEELEFVNAQGVSMTDSLEQAEEDLEDALDDDTLLAESMADMQTLTQEENADLKKALNSDWDFWEAQYQKEQRYLPADLQGKYRFHVQPEEIEGMHPRLRRHFSFKFASEGEITKYRAAEYVRKWGRHPGDTGNSAVQIAILTLRINHLTKTLRSNKGDTQNAYRLTGLVRRRKALMKHLKKADLRTYYSLLKDIDLRDQVELWTAARK